VLPFCLQDLLSLRVYRIAAILVAGSFACKCYEGIDASAALYE